MHQIPRFNPFLKTTALLLILFSTISFAQSIEPANYFDSPLTIIVPRGQGGGSHQLSKKMASSLEKIIGVDVKVVNMPGDDGKAAIRYFMEQPHDGMTLMQHVDDVPSAYAKKEISIDPTKDIVPVAVVQIAFSQLYIRNIEKRFGNWNEFLQYTLAHPGEVKVSLVGHKGAMESLLLEMLANETGMKLKHTAYNKPSERYMSLIKGDVDALIEQPGDVRPFLDRKMIKPILTLLPEPHPAFPEAAGLNSVSHDFPALYRSRMFFAHGDLPVEKLKYLEWALKKAFDSPSFQAFNEEKYMNLIDSYRDIEDGKAFVSDVIKTFKKIHPEDHQQSGSKH